jgi:hypothetical protein
MTPKESLQFGLAVSITFLHNHQLLGETPQLLGYFSIYL